MTFLRQLSVLMSVGLPRTQNQRLTSLDVKAKKLWTYHLCRKRWRNISYWNVGYVFIISFFGYTGLPYLGPVINFAPKYINSPWQFAFRVNCSTTLTGLKNQAGTYHSSFEKWFQLKLQVSHLNDRRNQGWQECNLHWRGKTKGSV